MPHDVRHSRFGSIPRWTASLAGLAPVDRTRAIDACPEPWCSVAVMATNRTSHNPDAPDFVCEHCGRTFESKASRGTHYRWCKDRPGYQPPAKKKRDYTQSAATRRQRRTAALKHGERSGRAFAAAACTEDRCQNEDGRPCEFREGVMDEGADNSVCWPDALGFSPDRRIRLDELTELYRRGLNDPAQLDQLKARFFALQGEAFVDAAQTALNDGLTQRADVLLYETPDGEQVIGQKLSQHPAARLAFGVLAKNLGATAEAEMTTRKSRGGAIGKPTEDGFDAASDARRRLLKDRR